MTSKEMVQTKDIEMVVKYFIEYLSFRNMPKGRALLIIFDDKYPKTWITSLKLYLCFLNSSILCSTDHCSWF